MFNPLVQFLVLRGYVETLARITGKTEKLPAQEPRPRGSCPRYLAHEALEDEKSRLIALPRAKFMPTKVSSRRTRTVASVPYIVLHMTGVEFGPDKKMKMKLLRSGQTEKDATLEARLYRFAHQTPYHRVVTRDGAILYNVSETIRSSHAGPGGNAGVGIGVEGWFPTRRSKQPTKRQTLPTQSVKDAFVAALKDTLETLGKGGAQDILVVWHSQLDKRKAADCCEELHLEAESVVRNYSFARMDRKFTAHTGVPLPF